MNDEIDISIYLKSLWRNKWVIVLVVCFSLIGSMYYLKNTPKTYLAKGTLFPVTSQQSALAATLQSLPFPSLGGGGDSSTHILAILNSKTLAQQVVTELDLVEYVTNINKDNKPFLTTLIDVVREGITYVVILVSPKSQSTASVKKPYIIDKEQRKNDTAIKYLKRRFSIKHSMKKNVIDIRVEWVDPSMAANIVNTYVSTLSNFINDNSLGINFQVIDIATIPTKKYRPKTLQVLLITMVFSFIVIVFAIMMKEMFYSKFPASTKTD